MAEGRAVSYAMARACRRIGLVGDRSASPHDFRRTVATWLADRGERSEVIEAILGHAPQGVTRRHYNLGLYLPFIGQAMQRWGDHVDSLITDEANNALPHYVPQFAQDFFTKRMTDDYANGRYPCAHRRGSSIPRRVGRGSFGD